MKFINTHQRKILYVRQKFRCIKLINGNRFAKKNTAVKEPTTTTGFRRASKPANHRRRLQNPSSTLTDEKKRKEKADSKILAKISTVIS